MAALPEPEERAREKGRLAGAVMEYLSNHPRSMDTAEGIAEWWIPATNRPVNLAHLQCVLDHLTEQGVLERVGSGKHAHYRAKREQQ
ncbi:MAG TPA: hypothetical protein VHT24_07475 [Pseudacidobacterium sp.]|nr:hypothetical protein [Pseudacidobacterium sp.]